MRSVIPVAILVLTSFALAGCAKDDGDDDLHYVCANGTEIHGEDHPEANATKAQDLAKFCPGSSTTGSRSNSTSAAPNVPPTLVVKITDTGGNETPITMLDGNLTFDASESTDSDGTVAGIAVTITDSNTTRTATLYDAAKKQFKPATFTFDRPGVVNVTIAMVDDRAGFTVNQTHVYVNHPQLGKTGGNIIIPTGEIDEDPCAPTNDDPLTNGNMYKPVSFEVHEGATFVTATIVSGGGKIGICTPETETGDYGELISNTGSDVITNPGPLVAPTGTKSYNVGVFGTTPNSAPVFDVIVHYEPDTRAAAA